jgi:integrase
VAPIIKKEYEDSLNKPQGKDLFISDLLDLYHKRTEREKAKATLKSEKSLRKTLNRFFGHFRLSEVTRSILLDHIERRLSTVKKAVEGEIIYISARTVRAEMVLFQHAFNLAYSEWDLIDFNPFEKVRLPKVKRKPKRYLEFEEQDLLIEAVEPKYRDIFIVAYDSGLRRRNINELEWNQVDLGKKVIRIPETKNKEPIDVPMTGRVFDALNRIKGSLNVNIKWVFFNPQTGKAFHPDTFTDIARRAADKLGWKDVNFHTSRHSVCSILAINGATEKDIMEAAGHKDPKTSSHYTRTNLERKKKTIMLLERPNKNARGC